MTVYKKLLLTTLFIFFFTGVNNIIQASAYKEFSLSFDGDSANKTITAMVVSDTGAVNGASVNFI